ncbi:response regulator transcription factor [Intrasporangium mesophilum]
MRIEVALMAEAPLVVEGLKRLLELHDHHGEVTLRELGLWDAIPPDVDLVLYDVFGPDRRYIVVPPALDARDAAKRAGRVHAKLILFGWQIEPHLIDDALAKNQADGYISKGLPADELVGAVRRAARESRIVVLLPRPALVDPRAGDEHFYVGQREGLSERESEVMGMIAQGMSNQDIAGRLHITVNTLKFYIRGAYQKLGLTRRSQAVAWARSHGFGEHDAPRSYTVLHPQPPSEDQ